ncbi:MAG: hypothetical protein M3R62_10150, partial [Acidobacteriota bacterium]|nr:hypothetical protein [Acidobacteriota bacterium]
FGSTLAIYEDGALRGDRFPPVVLEPETFLSILAGVWSAPSPEVRGFEAGDALLVWQSAYPVQGVLDVPGQRFRSLLLVRDGRAFEASYSGSVDPWPARVELEDTSTANRLSLSLQAREPL